MNASIEAASPRRRGGVWVWLLCALALLPVGIALVAWLHGWDASPVHVVIDGVDEWSLDPGALSGSEKIGIALALIGALAVVAVVVPMVVLIALAAAAFGLVIGLGVPLLVLALVAAALLSPLLLLLVFGLWLWRRAAAPARPAGTNIAP